MLPPPGLEPSVTSLLQNATPTSAAAIATSFLNVGVDVPTPTISSIISLASATSAAAPPDNGECSLLGPFAILVQGALGLLALLSLVYKRWRERPQRPIKIWFFDASKQVFGSVLVHLANLFMSMLSSGQLSIKVGPEIVSARNLDLIVRMVDSKGKYKPNPCSFYLLNLAIDTTVGIPILIVLLRILTAFFRLTPIGSPPESIRSGNYGTPPRAWWWFKQSIIYFIGLMGMKTCVLIIFLMLPWISRVGDWALKWTEGDEVLQVVFVMFVFPVIMNATQYYIIDSFIQNQKPEHELVPDDQSEDDDETYVDPPTTGSEEIGSDDEDEDAEVLTKTTEGSNAAVETVKPKHSKGSKGSGSTKHSPLRTDNKDYDPLFDGESSPTVVGSATTRGIKSSESEDERKLAST